MTDDETRVAAIRERAEAATEGPWIDEFSGEAGPCVIPHDAQSTREAVARTFLLDARLDARFIAHAREDIPWLLDRLRAAEADRDTIQRRTEEREARRYHAAIGNWKNIAQTAEARAAEAEAVIAEAPHAGNCGLNETDHSNQPIGIPCTCWKSHYRAGADHE